MAAPWAWDETLYAGSAPYYVAGRLPYPSELGERIAVEAGLSGGELAADVGCGPGSLTLLLAPHVDEIVGIDPDTGMLQEAAAAAHRDGVRNVSWRRMRAEDLPADLCGVGLVTFAQSFHWMHQRRVARIACDMLRPAGRCVHVHATTHRGDGSVDVLPRPRPPYEQIGDLVRSYLGAERRAGRSSPPHVTPGREGEVYRAAGFHALAHVEIARGEVIERSIDDIVAVTFSLSSSTPHLFGSRRPVFEGELRTLLAAESHDGLFCERLPDLAFDVWRPERV
jgi:SAM-dependent methyltransferase